MLSSFLTISIPSGVLVSTAIERLLRLLFKNEAENPPRRFESARVKSPPSGFSTFITSAPWSARIMVESGPDMTLVISIILKPARGPDMGNSSLS